MKQFDEMNDSDFEEFVKAVDLKIGGDILGTTNGQGCGIFDYAEMAERFGMQTLIVAACETFRLLGVILIRAGETNYQHVLKDPVDDGVVFTGIYIDPNSIGELSGNTITEEELTKFIQGGVSVLGDGPKPTIQHCTEAGPFMLLEFIHAVIHAVGSILEEVPSIDLSDLDRYGLHTYGQKAAAPWN